MDKFHSKNNPTTRAFKNTPKVNAPLRVKTCRETSPGKRITSSKSKIRKTIAKMKNRIEKGRRPSLSVANPHSKGDRNSRAWGNFLETNIPAPIRTAVRTKLKTKTKNHIIIK